MTPQYYRKRAKLTQQALADQLGASKSFISRFEASERLLGFNAFCDWCDILHLSDSEIAGVVKAQQKKNK